MTRTASRKKVKFKKAVARTKPRKPMSDRAVYLGILLVGFFFVMLAWLFTDGRYWGYFALAYAALFAYLVNISTLQVYRGKHLAGWQQSLARVPLRFVGYGTKTGKPIEAAHDHPETFKALTASLIVTLAALAVLTFVVARWFS